MPLQEGTYFMEVKSLTVAPNKNGLLTAVGEYGCPDGSITAYHNLVKRDGSINEFTYKALQKAFGIQAKDPWDFEAAVGCSVKLVLAYEENQKGDYVLQVKWINHPDDQGGARQATPEDKQLFKSQYGSFFRALAETDLKPPVRGAGPTFPAPASTPPPPATPPAAGPPPWSPPAAPPSTEHFPQSSGEAWAQFNQAHSGEPEARITSLWFEALLGVLGTTQPGGNVTPSQWRDVVFYSPSPMPSDDIPF